ncbi:hypothetical protein RvY_05933 [Ramazzottius varieornatus]|uniref:Saposin B-type domain-containing protein n=1 Tax=Ramazzottius varieornatus TaxID=947166 RepID=A0A1D1UX93_RAMVA|nr:hypothetical protein RvY_05933 [Ramazzottius varieornatus]
MQWVILFLCTILSSCCLPLVVAVKPSGLACEGCHGVISELHGKLNKPTKASIAERVPALLNKICKLENLVRYVYSPPKMVKACNGLLGDHRKAITESLVGHFMENPKVSVEELEGDICFEIAGSCKGIKDSPAGKVSDKLVADQILKPATDGRIAIDPLGDKTKKARNGVGGERNGEPLTAGNSEAEQAKSFTRAAQGVKGTSESLKKRDKKDQNQFFGFSSENEPQKAKPAQKDEL